MNTNPTLNNAIALNISTEAHDWARLFAAKQRDVATGKQVYLNTLAVHTLHQYLAQQGIESDLEQSHSWYPHGLSVNNAADLMVPTIGRIECRPTLLTTDLTPSIHLTIPDTAWEDRVSYVAVGMGDRLDRLCLLGYLPVRSPRILEHPIASSSLLPMVKFPNHLRLLQDGNRWLDSDDTVATQVRELLDTYSLSQLIAKLEVAYNESAIAAQDLRIGDCLIEVAVEVESTTKEAVLKKATLFGLKADDDPSDENVEDILDTLAENVLECLQHLWGDRHRRAS